jgi:hypothetical protein
MAFVGDEGVAEAGFGPAAYTPHLAPLRAVKVGEMRIALDVGIDLGEFEPLRQRQRMGIQFGAANDEQLSCRSACVEIFRRRPASADFFKLLYPLPYRQELPKYHS